MYGDNSEKSSMRRSTIVLSIMIICLCFVSAVGMTWALFTSGGEDGTIGVNASSGKLRVDIVDTEGNSLDGQSLGLLTTSDSRTILFEPGACYRTQSFKIKNSGNITANYRVYISYAEGTDAEQFRRAFDVYVTSDPDDLDSGKRIYEFSGTLVENSFSDTYFLVVKMKESAGNEFQSMTFTGLGVTVFAVQGNVETSRAN